MNNTTVYVQLAGKVVFVVKVLFVPIFTRSNPISQYPGKQGFTSGKNVYLTVSQANIFIQKINVSNLWMFLIMCAMKYFKWLKEIWISSLFKYVTLLL